MKLFQKGKMTILMHTSSCPLGEISDRIAIQLADIGKRNIIIYCPKTETLKTLEELKTRFTMN